MIHKLRILLLSVLILLAGCSAHTAETVPTTAPIETTVEASEPMTEPAILTEAPIETASPLIEIPSGAHACRFTSETSGDYLDYYLFVPNNAVAGMPLVVFLHGDGEVDRIESLESYGPILALRELYGDDFPCILISPCTRQPSWTNDAIPDTLIDLIEFVAEECDTDTERIIITGHSRGAIGVWYFLSEYGDYFSAAVPVSCGSDRSLNYENVSKVPVYAMAGDVGEYENIYRSEMENLVLNIQTENGNAVFECLEGCAHMDTVSAAYSVKIIEWMLEQ